MQSWKLERGATPASDGSVRFSVWAPEVTRLDVVLVKEGGRSVHTMERGDDGVHELVVADVPVGSDYLYRLDSQRDRPDPVSRCQPGGVHAASRVVDPREFRWSDEGWTGLELSELVLYEIHVGTFSDNGSFDAVVDRLPYLRDLGITALELMPVAQFPGERNWGYDGVHPYAPQMSYGGPDGLRRLVDAAHAEGFSVVLDVVYNHLGPEGNYLSEFGPYFTDRYSTPWGRAINFDGPQSDSVRRYFIDNALHWITEYHVDGLRLDAVQAIFDFGALHILQELAESVHSLGAALGRRVHVIAESDLNDPRLVRGRELGGYGLDACWSDDFHHAVHSALTSERNGYYCDFGGVEKIAKVMSDRFVLDGAYSKYRRRRHGAAAHDVSADRFVIFVQNHDQVGNRACGERLARLTSFEQRKLAAALLLLSPYVPLLFMGEEYGAPQPFLYFVDHADPELLAAVRAGREREFASFEWAGSIPDPAAEETFDRSRLHFADATRSPHRELLRLYRDLIRTRRSEPALRPGAVAVRVVQQADAPLVALWFEGAGRDLVAAFNCSERGAALDLLLPAGRWDCRIATDDPRYGGTGMPGDLRSFTSTADEAVIQLAAHSASLYARESG